MNEMYKPKQEIRGDSAEKKFYLSDNQSLTYEEVEQIKHLRLREAVNKLDQPIENEASGTETDEEWAQKILDSYIKHHPENKKEYWTNEVIAERMKRNFNDWKSEKNKNHGFGQGYILRHDPDFYWHIRFNKNGDFEPYISAEIRDAWHISQEIPQALGLILQYAVENVLNVVGNENLFVEKSFSKKRPDLAYLTGEKPIFFDIKLQSTTKSIKKDIENYAKIIAGRKQKKRGGGEGEGYIIFLCLNGPKLKNEELKIGDTIIRIKYYHVQSFIRQLANNNRHLLRFITGKEALLSQEKIAKLREIYEALGGLSELVRSNLFTQRGISLKDAYSKYRETTREIRQLAKEKNIKAIMQTNFRDLLNF